MKLKDAFLVHNTDRESFLVPTGAAEFSGLVRGNAVFGRILELLTAETGEEEIVASLTEEFDASADRIASDVRKTLSALREIGALDE
jgi:hypothetical protein